ADDLVLAAQRDALARLAVHALGAGGAVRVAVGHLVADHAAGLGRGVLGAALALGAVHDLAADVALVDLVADHAAGDRAGRGGGLLAAAAADLVADQAADDRTGDGAADVAVALRQALLHDHVLAHLVRDRLGAGLAHRLGADDGGIQLGLLGHRGDAHDLGVFQRRGRRERFGGRHVAVQGRGGGGHVGAGVAVVHVGGGGNSADQQSAGSDENGGGLLHGLGSSRVPSRCLTGAFHHGEPEQEHEQIFDAPTT